MESTSSHKLFPAWENSVLDLAELKILINFPIAIQTNEGITTTNVMESPPSGYQIAWQVEGGRRMRKRAGDGCRTDRQTDRRMARAHSS
jgi:hypothetical protein